MPDAYPLSAKIRENIENCRDNGYALPKSDEDAVLEMIEQGALPEDTPILLATDFVGVLRRRYRM